MQLAISSWRTEFWSLCEKYKRPTLTLAILWVMLLPAAAQQNDFGVWGSIAVKHKFSQKLSATVEEQLRMNQNATAIAQYFTDASLEYSLSKKFKVAVAYRFINTFHETYYSKRHRIYADLSYKTKFRKFQFLLRTRFQEQQQDIHSSEIGFIPAWYNRDKLTIKLDLTKKYTPYASVEMYYRIYSANDDANIIDKWRYTIGCEYEFNRVHSLDLYYMFQRERMVNNPSTDFIVGIGYVYTF